MGRNTNVLNNRVPYSPRPQTAVRPTPPPVENPVPQTPTLRMAIPAASRQIDQLCVQAPLTVQRSYLAASLVNFANFGHLSSNANLAAMGADGITLRTVDSETQSYPSYNKGAFRYCVLPAQYTDIVVICNNFLTRDDWTYSQFKTEYVADENFGGRIAYWVQKAGMAIEASIQSTNSPEYRPKTFIGANFAGSVAGWLSLRYKRLNRPLNDCWAFGMMPFMHRECQPAVRALQVPLFQVQNAKDWICRCPYFTMEKTSQTFRDEFFNDAKYGIFTQLASNRSAGAPYRFGRQSAYNPQWWERTHAAGWLPNNRWFLSQSGNFFENFHQEFVNNYLNEIWGYLDRDAAQSVSNFDTVNNVNPSFSH